VFNFALQSLVNKTMGAQEIDQLREKERASEMTIRGLEDEIRLLRKQNNEIDKLWRCSDEKLRMTNEDLLRKGARDMETASRFSRANSDVDNQALQAAESQLRSLKRQCQQAEADAETYRQQMCSLSTKVQELEERRNCERVSTSSARSKSVDEKMERKSREQEAQLQARISELQGLLTQRDTDLLAFKAQLKDADKARDDARQFQQRFAEAEREVAQLRTSLAAEADKLKERNRLLELASSAADERAELEKRLALMEKERDRNSDAQQRALGEKQSDYEALLQSKAALEKELKTCQKSLSDQHGMLCDAEQKCRSLEAEFKRQTTDVAGSLQQQLAELKQRLEQSQADVAIAENAMNAARQEAEKLRAELAARQAADAESLSRLCKIRELEAELRAEKQGGAEQRAALKARIELLEERSANKTASDECARLQREMEALRKTHADEVAGLSKRAEDGASALEQFAKQVQDAPAAG
jgi:chromosome segregation ATPase